MLLTPKYESVSPLAGWLSKMVSFPFGRTRWVSKFFVLLDSELRFYKDEHSESASQVLNLRQIGQVISAPTTNHPYCFRLEPKQDQMMRPWIIECKTKRDMNTWISAIKQRILKYSPASTPTAFSIPLSPKSPYQLDTTESTLSLEDKAFIAASPDVFRMPTLPLRCTNINQGVERDSLLVRRNKKLAPIVTQLPILSAHSSSSISLPSPTGAVLGPSSIISPGIINRYCYGRYQNESKSFVPKGVLGVQEEKECDTVSLESLSPTYLMYKKRFHL
ncbi:MAG: hypothetical protein EXX96DRAFT_557008 [Benjaminiella poitrasii]|nr:MAG: hypothetical protein EXX96DRAFT_557008 [Benjaminiella poitrasii]